MCIRDRLYISNISQSTFTNAGGDNLWSNAANWSAGIPNVDTAKVTVDADLIVDSNKTVGQIKTNNDSSAASVTITASNNSVLTITGSGEDTSNLRAGMIVIGNDLTNGDFPNYTKITTIGDASTLTLSSSKTTTSTFLFFYQ